MVSGFVVGILFAPDKGSVLRKKLFRGDNDSEPDWGNHGTYAINELIGENSDTLEEIREKLAE